VRVVLISRHDFSNRLEFRAAPILTVYSAIDESIVETGHNSQMQTLVCYQMEAVQDVDNRRLTERSSMNTTERMQRMRENLKKCRDRLKEKWHLWWECWCGGGGGR
jgi:hypothetical protein